MTLFELRTLAMSATAGSCAVAVVGFLQRNIPVEIYSKEADSLPYTTFLAIGFCAFVGSAVNFFVAVNDKTTLTWWFTGVGLLLAGALQVRAGFLIKSLSSKEKNKT